MIDDIIKTISQKIPQSYGINLDGFKIDCDYLIEDKRFLSTSVVLTNNSENMIKIIIEIDESFGSIQKLSNRLRFLYSLIEYSHFSSYSIEWLQDKMLFRFITVISKDKFYVSGSIEISNNNYRKLYEKYLAEFGDILDS